MGVRPKMNVISLTDAAAARVQEIIANAGKPLYGLRVGVTNGGCAGMSYTMELAGYEIVPSQIQTRLPMLRDGADAPPQHEGA